MKKLALAIGLLASSALLVNAQNEVYSQNAVGYIKVEVPSNGLMLVSAPFVNIDQSEMTVQDAFGVGVPDLTVVHIWDSKAKKYNSITYFDPDGWLDDDFNPAGTNIVGRGDGVWVKNATSSNLTIFIMGEVPGTDFPTKAIEVPEGIRLISFSYPVEINVTNALTGIVPQDLDVIFEWKSDQKYESFTYFDPDGWLDDDFNPVNIVLKPGVSYWYRTASTQIWNQVKPYTYP